MTFIEKTLPVINVKGLHARASAKFVETVESFNADAMVTRDGMTVSGDSIMGLLMLAASNGTSIAVRTDGPEAESLASALEELLNNRFGEEA